MRRCLRALTTLLALTVAAPGQDVRMTSSVLGSDALPLRGAVLSVVYGNARHGEIARTDADGRCTFPIERRALLERGGRLLVIEAAGHCSAALDIRKWFGAIVLPPVMLGRAQVLHGRVRDSEGRPLAGVRVEATAAT